MIVRDVTINSLRDIGAAAGATRTLTPSAPIDIAFDIIAKAAESYSVLNPIDNLAIFFTTLAILACMGVVAANVLLALVTAWVVAYAGIFVLGFGGSRWTSDIAINYFRAVVGIALKLMTMTLLIGVAVSVMDGFHADLQKGAPMRELLVIFVVSLVLVVLIHSIPNVIAGLIPGGGHAASSGSSFSAGAIAGAAVGAAAAAASGGLHWPPVVHRLLAVHRRSWPRFPRQAKTCNPVPMRLPACGVAVQAAKRRGRSRVLGVALAVVAIVVPAARHLPRRPVSPVPVPARAAVARGAAVPNRRSPVVANSPR